MSRHPHVVWADTSRKLDRVDIGRQRASSRDGVVAIPSRYDIDVVAGPAGQRIAVGASTEDIVAEYHDLEAEDVKQALAYAAWVADERVFRPVGRTA